MPKSKDYTANVRVSAHDLKVWKSAAEQSGLSLSAWVRIMCNGNELTSPKR